MPPKILGSGAEPQNPIHADVRRPDEAELLGERRAREVSEHEQRHRPEVDVNAVVQDTADARVDEVAQHAKIRREQQQHEQQPVSALIEVEKNGEQQDGCAFEVEEETGHKHSQPEPLVSAILKSSSVDMRSPLNSPYTKRFGSLSTTTSHTRSATSDLGCKANGFVGWSR